MGKGIIGAILYRDPKRLLVNSVGLGGFIFIGKLSDIGVKAGKLLLKNNKILKGSSMLIGSQLLSKIYLAFVGIDLRNKWNQYLGGDKEALVGIAGDSAIIAVNVIEKGASLFSSFASIEAESIEFGPYVMLFEFLVFTGTDSFYAERAVDKIEEIISLSWVEHAKEFVRKFFDSDISKNKES